MTAIWYFRCECGEEIKHYHYLVCPERLYEEPRMEQDDEYIRCRFCWFKEEHICWEEDFEEDIEDSVVLSKPMFLSLNLVEVPKEVNTGRERVLSDRVKDPRIICSGRR